MQDVTVSLEKKIACVLGAHAALGVDMSRQEMSVQGEPRSSREQSSEPCPHSSCFGLSLPILVVLGFFSLSIGGDGP